MEFCEEGTISQKYLEEEEMQEIEVEVVQTQGYNNNGEFVQVHAQDEIPANQLGLVDISDSQETLRDRLRRMIKRKNNRPTCLESDDEEDAMEQRIQKRESNGYERDLEQIARKYGRARTSFLPSPTSPTTSMDVPAGKTVSAMTQTPPVAMTSKSLMSCVSDSSPNPSKQAKQDLHEDPEKLMPVHDQNVITKGSYLLPVSGGRQKENIAYEFGNPQYRAVLGHNTIFKVKKYLF